MRLEFVDWTIIVGYFVVALGIGLAFRKKAGGSMVEYFVSGRSLPWWIAGTSMVATTFAADTPLAVTGLVAKFGLAGNWFWWAFALGGMVTVFVYARLWRRTEVLTDVELVELRYGGKPAAFLRGFRALYIALLINPIIIGWVTGAMLKVLKHTVLSGGEGSGPGDWSIIIAMLVVVGVYSTVSGMWGVAVTDFFQFILAMAGCIALAVVSVSSLGGIGGMRHSIVTNIAGGEQMFRFLPDFRGSDPWMPIGVLLVMLFVQWWASWYPGAEPGGGGFIVQRMASCKNERHAVWATLWFQIAHYCIRPWPWLLVSFVAVAHYPGLREMADPGVGFPMVIRDFAPAGLRGLMIVAFFSAYMSTMSTQINWGASYLASDFYKRFINPNASDSRLTEVSRMSSIFILITGGVAAWIMKDVSVDQAWRFLASLGAGTGAVFMLRWFWWRINAWTEISAMISSVAFYTVISRLFPMDEEYRLALVAVLTIAVWLVVTWITPAEDEETLCRFYRKVRPAGKGWQPIAKICPDVICDSDLALSVTGAIASGMVVYLLLPGVGFVIFRDFSRAALCVSGALACATLVWFVLLRMYPAER
ncbi:sodium:solute symporter family protein [Dethiosulfovibrio salsuginis]|uniref:Na+/proline symporter n=1 Tax=Dethiosulfovibrio salsuginis TaxID=561720 RepID=A0A1X7IFJ7_9BACT|nr:sodium:solute symporter family protein [Dethiosulfovibrio salsuginis]SMG13387.1 Na+/proline symporter [Dethiosulfovibrio salsuginis]